jgi:multimeric flavodoxin WrbA
VPKTLKIVGLGGSLAGNSKSRAALRTAWTARRAPGAATQLLDIRHLGLPMYNPDDHEPTETTATLIESCHAAHGLLWSSPLYQGTISGVLKNRSTGCAAVDGSARQRRRPKHLVIETSSAPDMRSCDDASGGIAQ